MKNHLLISALALGAAAFAPCTLRADAYLFSALAGNGAVLDHSDGTGTNARFFNPTSVAIDSGGTLYVADGGDHTIRKITAGGVVTTLAGQSGTAGNVDGTGSGALFMYPYAVAVDAGGNVYVTDIGTSTIRKVTPSGSTSTLAGSAGVTGSADGTGTAALFNYPEGIAVDATGNVFVADTGNSTLRRIAAANGAVTTLAGSAGVTGSSDGTGSGALFNYPYGIAVDASDNVYVADFDNSSIRKVTAAGTVTTLAGTSGQTGTVDGTGSAARFDHPGAVAVDSTGNVYVIDSSNQLVRKVSAAGAVTTIAGGAGLAGDVDAAGSAARFFYAFGLAVNGAGTSIYVADTGNHSIRSVTSGGSVSTLAGASGREGLSDGTGTSALFAYPDGLAVDSAGNVYVADHDNDTIRKISAAGAVTTLAGGAGVAGSADGAGTAARFNGPTGVAVDASGVVYVADAGNNTIRKITAGGAVATLAGTAGVTGNGDGTGAAAQFNKPQGVAVDAAGNVYVADTNNSVIRKITPAGAVTTLAGAAGQTGSTDGAGGAARFNGPYAIAIDGSGNLYTTDFFNDTVRKITSSGAVTTLAGAAGQAGDVDGAAGAARFNQSYGIAVDASGNVLVADTYNRVVRRISSGTVSTVGGTLSRFYYPQGIAVDASGNVYVADGDNQMVTKGLLVATPPNGIPVASETVAVGQSTIFTLSSPAPSGVTYQWQVSSNSGASWTSLTDSATYSGSTTASLTIASASSALNGLQYRVQLTDAGGTGTSGAATFTVTGSGGGSTSGTARLVNLSARSQVGTGNNVAIIGVVIGGSGSKQMIVRGVGPGLTTTFGLAGTLNNPQLTLLNNSGASIAGNTGWGTATNASAMPAAFSQVGAFSLTANSADSVIMQPMASGNYTAQLSGVGGTSGIGLSEFYDADTGTPAARLMNISARALVGTGNGILIAGFAVEGTGTETVLIRGVGPGLNSTFGLTGILTAPTITVYNSAGAAIASNSGWDGSGATTATFTKVGAFSLVPGSTDCVLIMTLNPGTYTVQMSGVGGTTGIGLAEIYEIPAQ